MKKHLFTFSACVLLASLFTNALQAQESRSEFASSVIDLGVVVSDIDRSAQFYTNAIGFKEVPGFTVPADFASEAALTAGKPLHIRVFTLGDGQPATKLKLMQIEGVRSKKSDNTHIHSQLGYSYTTIMVNDISAALARLEKAGVKTKSNGAVPLPKGFPEGIYLILVADPDGNLVELVGPKK